MDSDEWREAGPTTEGGADGTPGAQPSQGREGVRPRVPATNYCAQIAAFLLDTLPIRITRKSFACIIGAHSNRHLVATLSCIGKVAS